LAQLGAGGWRESGTITRSPGTHPLAVSVSVSVVLPAAGSTVSRENVGVRG
jgi:hypothetical protein